MISISAQNSKLDHRVIREIKGLCRDEGYEFAVEETNLTFPRLKAYIQAWGWFKIKLYTHVAIHFTNQNLDDKGQPVFVNSYGTSKLAYKCCKLLEEYGFKDIELIIQSDSPSPLLYP